MQPQHAQPDASGQQEHRPRDVRNPRTLDLPAVVFPPFTIKHILSFILVGLLVAVMVTGLLFLTRFNLVSIILIAFLIGPSFMTPCYLIYKFTSSRGENTIWHRLRFRLRWKKRYLAPQRRQVPANPWRRAVYGLTVGDPATLIPTGGRDGLHFRPDDTLETPDNRNLMLVDVKGRNVFSVPEARQIQYMRTWTGVARLWRRLQKAMVSIDNRAVSIQDVLHDYTTNMRPYSAGWRRISRYKARELRRELKGSHTADLQYTTVIEIPRFTDKGRTKRASADMWEKDFTDQLLDARIKSTRLSRDETIKRLYAGWHLSDPQCRSCPTAEDLEPDPPSPPKPLKITGYLPPKQVFTARRRAVVQTAEGAVRALRGTRREDAVRALGKVGRSLRQATKGPLLSEEERLEPRPTRSRLPRHLSRRARKERQKAGEVREKKASAPYRERPGISKLQRAITDVPIELYEDRLRVDDVWCATITLLLMPQSLRPGVLDQIITGLPFRTRIGFHMEGMERERAMRTLGKEQISARELNADTEKKRGIGYLDAETRENELKWLRPYLAAEGHRNLQRVSVYVTVMADTEEELETHVQTAIATIKTMDCDYGMGEGIQLELFTSTLPINLNRVHRYMTTTTEAVGQLFPYIYRVPGDPTGSIVGRVGNSLVRFNRFGPLSTQIVAVYGETGSGKTVLTQILAGENLRIGGTLLVFDKANRDEHGHFWPLCEVNRGTYVRILADEHALNPWEIFVDEESLLELHRLFLRKERLSGWESTVLSQSIQWVLDKHKKTETIPVERELVEHLAGRVESLPDDRKRDLEEIIFELDKYTADGKYGRFFGRQTTFKLNKHVLVLDYGSVHKEQIEAVMYLLFRVHNLRSEGHEAERAAVGLVFDSSKEQAILDEQWWTLQRAGQGEEVQNIGRAGRHNAKHVVVASQKVGDQSDDKLAADMHSSVSTTFLLRTHPSQIEKVASEYELNDAEVHALTDITQNTGNKTQAMMIERHLNDSVPSRGMFEITLTRREYWLYASHSWEIAIREQALEMCGENVEKALILLDVTNGDLSKAPPLLRTEQIDAIWTQEKELDRKETAAIYRLMHPRRIARVKTRCVTNTTTM